MQHWRGGLIAPAEEEAASREVDHRVGEDSELIEVEDEAGEAEPLKVAPSPKQPSAADIELHRIAR